MALRTVKAFWRQLRATDPNNPIGLGTLRAAVKSGVIPSIQIGRNRVIETDTALDYLFAAQGQQQPHKPGEVRKVEQ